MTYSRTNSISSEVLSDDPLSEGTLTYLEARAKNIFYDYVMTRFKMAEQSGFTKAQLARRLNKRPDQISHILGAPGNWTLGMIAALLVGISKEELLPYSVSFIGRPPRNRQVVDCLDEEKGGWNSGRKDGTGTITSEWKISE